MGNDDCTHAIRIGKVAIEVLEISQAFIFFLYLLGLIVEIKWVGAGLEFL